MRFSSRPAWLRVLRCALLVLWFVGGVGAWAQQLVTDAPVAKQGGTAFVGRYTAVSVFSAGPAFHFTEPVTITSIAYDAGPAGVQELTVRALDGCTVGGVTAAGVVCGIETGIASRYPGMRYGTLRIRTTNGVFTVPVAWESVGAEVAVTPGVLRTPNGTAGVMGNSLALDAVGNIYLSGSDDVIRKVDASSGAVTLVAGVAGSGDSDGDGGPATSAHIGSPVDVVVSPAGDVYVVSSSPGTGDVVRKVDGHTGLISTVANFGTGRGAGEQGNVGAVAVDDQGNIYASLTGNGALTAAAGDGGTPRYLIGGKQDAALGCNADASFVPTALAIHGGKIYFASGAAVYKVSADSTVCHTPVLVAGTGVAGNSGDAGLAVRAAIGRVSGLAVDAAGDLYLADADNNTVRVVSGATGIITTVAGSGSALPDVTVSGGRSSLALDFRGNLYVLSPSGAVQQIDVSRGALSYAATAVGQISSDSPRGAMFTNIGNDTLPSAPASPALQANGFVLSPTTTCGRGNAVALPAGASCVVGVDFKPTIDGASQGALSLGDTAVDLQGTSLTEEAPPTGTYAVWVSPGTLTVQEGASGSAQFVFAPAGGFRGAVTFACAGLPVNATCSFAPATLTADGTDRQQASVLTITVRGASMLAARNDNSRRGLTLASLLGLNGLVLAWLKLRRRGALSMKLAGVVLLLSLSVAGASGCGSGGAVALSPSAASTRVNVVTTSAADGSTQSATFVLTVK